MTLYAKLAQDIAKQIRAGVLRPGDRLPTVRQLMHNRHVSRGTVVTAYRMLENLGEVRARPRSGYYVQPRVDVPRTIALPPSQRTAHAVEVSDQLFELLDALKNPKLAHLASPWIDFEYFPLAKVDLHVARATRRLKPESFVATLPPGDPELKRLLRRRYLESGCAMTADEIVVTSGAAEALQLALHTVTRPGDTVAIESPAFYGALHAAELYGLKTLEIATDPRSGIDLGALQTAIKRSAIKACWVMTNFQNPLGFVMDPDKKKELVRLLTRHRIPLIEDDVYEDLYFSDRKPVPAKAYDNEGYVLHCSSFSKSLSPGYRVGWVSAGRYAKRVQHQKWINTITTNMQGQAGIAEYLKYGGHDHYLRGLRRTLAGQLETMTGAIAVHFPSGTSVSKPSGGYFVWLELPAGVKASEVQRAAFANGITVASGPLFTSQRRFQNCLRLNYGQRWTERIARAVATVGRLVSSMT